ERCQDEHRRAGEQRAEEDETGAGAEGLAEIHAGAQGDQNGDGAEQGGAAHVAPRSRNPVATAAWSAMPSANADSSSTMRSEWRGSGRTPGARAPRKTRAPGTASRM